jgi:predicted dehydrogenase
MGQTMRARTWTSSTNGWRLRDHRWQRCSPTALGRGHHARASRFPGRHQSQPAPTGRGFPGGFLQALIYVHCAAVLREVLDPETARTARAEGSALSLKETLDAELTRIGRTTTGNLGAPVVLSEPRSENLVVTSRTSRIRSIRW